MTAARRVTLLGCALAACLAIAGGCDVRPLQLQQLLGNGDGGTGRDADGAVTPAPDTAPTDGGGGGDSVDTPPSCPPCGPSEYCEPPATVCRPRTGAGKLSGSLREGCTGRGITARIGIAGRRQCSVDLKGSYYFDNLPEGALALVAFKDGYKHFEVIVTVTATGTIQDIVLQPDAPYSCASPPPDVACACNIPGCP